MIGRATMHSAALVIFTSNDGAFSTFEIFMWEVHMRISSLVWGFGPLSVTVTAQLDEAFV